MDDLDRDLRALSRAEAPLPPHLRGRIVGGLPRPRPLPRLAWVGLPAALAAGLAIGMLDPVAVIAPLSGGEAEFADLAVLSWEDLE
ncbi:hypothetical protein JQC91_12220 [Jannaschia sp. Os4]|uniref:hypothetical protein n=1 Tax=Jannaschia sp. Os4 TaxID=2807617 RepID=UPI00193928ED|nr:hypothetical protein [Jannaschia sp. Os4]MBM2577064.1 hypothetical protein [Jannaschia sp. Os4]